MSNYKDQIKANTQAIQELISNAQKIAQLSVIGRAISNTDKIALYKHDTGETVQVSIEDLLGTGGGSGQVSHPMLLPFTFPLNNKDSLPGLHGALFQTGSQSGIVLNSGQTITDDFGTSKALFVVNAGVDTAGTFTITGTSVDRNTGAETASDTEVITIAGLTTDSSTTDSNGNPVHAFSNAYMSSKWWKGTITLSTTTVELSDIDIYQCGFEQFNDIGELTIETVDLTYTTLNTTAEMDAYCYAVEVSNGVATITKISELHHATGQNDAVYRKRQGGINKDLDTTTDGIFFDIFTLPASQEYFAGFSANIWANVDETVNVTIDGSIALDEITYGETLAVGDLVYLKPADGKYWKADNTSEDTSTTELRLILESGVADDVKLALEEGKFSTTGLTAGLEYVGTSGAVTSSKPTGTGEVVRIVSTAINATTRYFSPDASWVDAEGLKVNGITLVAGNSEFVDNTFVIKNVANLTKKLAFDLSNISNNTTINLTVQDKDGTVATLADSYKAKVSSNDTTADYLLSKLIMGANITLTEVNDGGDEKIRISASTGAAGAQKEVTASTYTILDTDNGLTIWFNNPTGVTVTLDTLTVDNFACDFYNEGAGDVTFVDGTASAGYPDGNKLEQDKVGALVRKLSTTTYKYKGEFTT